VSGGAQLLQEPAQPEDWSDAVIAKARSKVASLVNSHRLDQEMAALAGEVSPPPRSCPEAAAPCAPAGAQPLDAAAASAGGAGSGSSIAAAALMRGESEILEDPGGAGSCSAGAEKRAELAGGKAERLALLQYKQGSVSRHSMLLKVADARAAARPGA
jgi:hypothetical protein